MRNIWYANTLLKKSLRNQRRIVNKTFGLLLRLYRLIYALLRSYTFIITDLLLNKFSTGPSSLYTQNIINVKHDVYLVKTHKYTGGYTRLRTRFTKYTQTPFVLPILFISICVTSIKQQSLEKICYTYPSTLLHRHQTCIVHLFR